MLAMKSSLFIIFCWCPSVLLVLMRGQRLGAASSVLSQVDTALASGLLPSSLHHTLLNPVLVQVYMFTIYAKSKFTKPKSTALSSGLLPSFKPT